MLNSIISNLFLIQFLNASGGFFKGFVRLAHRLIASAPSAGNLIGFDRKPRLNY